LAGRRGLVLVGLEVCIEVDVRVGLFLLGLRHLVFEIEVVVELLVALLLVVVLAGLCTRRAFGGRLGRLGAGFTSWRQALRRWADRRAWSRSRRLRRSLPLGCRLRLLLASGAIFVLRHAHLLAPTGHVLKSSS
jgi:hypothetical protein